VFWRINGRLNPRRQGDLGEVSALAWLVGQGYVVWTPFGHSPNADLIAEQHDGRLLRVQVKTSNFLRGHRYEVATCTRRQPELERHRQALRRRSLRLSVRPLR